MTYLVSIPLTSILPRTFLQLRLVALNEVVHLFALLLKRLDLSDWAKSVYLHLWYVKNIYICVCIYIYICDDNKNDNDNMLSIIQSIWVYESYNHAPLWSLHPRLQGLHGAPNSTLTQRLHGAHGIASICCAIDGQNVNKKNDGTIPTMRSRWEKSLFL